jgi:hypothetical protein
VFNLLQGCADLFAQPKPDTEKAWRAVHRVMEREGGRREFAPDASQEEDGFEPSFRPRKRRPQRGGPRRTIVVSQDDLCVMIRSSLSVPAGNSREPLPQERDRWFESGSLQRRVTSEPEFRPASPILTRASPCAILKLSAPV